MTDGGIDILVNDWNLLKVLLFIIVTDGGIVNCTNDLHSSNAFFPIYVTDDGISISKSNGEQLNA